MNKNDNLSRLNSTSQTFNSNVSGDVGQGCGDRGEVILSCKGNNSNQNSDMEKAVMESINRAFGKISLEENLEADRRAYVMKPIL